MESFEQKFRLVKLSKIFDELPEGQVNGTFDPYMKVFDNKITPASILGYPQDIPA